MKNDYDTDLDVMFCWGYGFINDPVCSMESDGKKEPERTGQKTINFQKEKQSNTVIIKQKGELKNEGNDTKRESNGLFPP